MPRQSREAMKSESEARCYHIICRVTQRQFWLKRDRQKTVLRNQLWKVSEFCGVEVLGYCWMDNHIHLLVRVPKSQTLSQDELIRRSYCLYGRHSIKGQRIEAILRGNTNEAEVLRGQLLLRMHDLSQFVKEWKQRFSIWHNRSFRTFGTLWSERFKSLWVEDTPHVLRSVAAYIHLNPVRAGMVSHPGEYRFSLYGECCDQTKNVERSERAHRSFCQLMGNSNSVKKAREAFERFFKNPEKDVGDDCWFKKVKNIPSGQCPDHLPAITMSKGHAIGTTSFLQKWKKLERDTSSY